MAFIKALMDYNAEVSTSGSEIYIPDTALTAIAFERNSRTDLQFITVFEKITESVVVDSTPPAQNVTYYRPISIALSRIKVTDVNELA